MSSFVASLRSEQAKVVSTKAWLWLALIMFLYVGVSAAGIATILSLGASMGAQADEDLQKSLAGLIYSLAVSVGYVFPLILGVLAITGEYRHRTITPTFLLTSHRNTVLVSKLVVLTGWGALFGLVAWVSTVGAGGIALAVTGQNTALASGDTYLMILRGILAMALWGAIGIGVGVLIPNQAGAIVVVLAFTQFVEPILRAVAGFWQPSAAVAQFLPGSASEALVGGGSFTSISTSGGTMLDWWAGGLVLLALAVVTGVVGAVTTWRRDVS